METNMNSLPVEATKAVYIPTYTQPDGSDWHIPSELAFIYNLVRYGHTTERGPRRASVSPLHPVFRQDPWCFPPQHVLMGIRFSNPYWSLEDCDRFRDVVSDALHDQLHLAYRGPIPDVTLIHRTFVQLDADTPHSKERFCARAIEMACYTLEYLMDVLADDVTFTFDPEDLTDPDEGGRDGRLVLASFERCFPLYHDSEARYSAGVVSPESSFTEG
jgi:hypothetical protein